jgi:uncharacterized membrane protein
VFGFLKRKQSFFHEQELKRIAEAVQQAEMRTSGEIRVYVESRCSYVDAMDRAMEIFLNLQMHKTHDRNAVLLYVAIRDHQLAILGDEGIHRKVGNEYWQKEVTQMIKAFNQDNCADGIIKCVKDIGEALHKHFPYDSKIDKNELPDDIVFGR